MRQYHTCKNPECTNPKNGSLVEDDYPEDKKRGAKPCRRTMCRICVAEERRMWARKWHYAQKAIFGGMTQMELDRCPLDVRRAQDFCLGRA